MDVLVIMAETLRNFCERKQNEMIYESVSKMFESLDIVLHSTTRYSTIVLLDIVLHKRQTLKAYNEDCQ